VYQVVTSGKIPMLQILLWNNHGKLQFPRGNNELVKHICESHIDGCVTGTCTENADHERNQWTFFSPSSSEQYLWYDATPNNIHIRDMECMNRLWWVSMDEIMNKRKLMHIPIHPWVTQFFMSHPEFCYVYPSATYPSDMQQRMLATPYPVPTIMYAHKPTHHKANFAFVFGQGMTHALFGNAYYFYHSLSSLKKVDDSGWLVRTAVWMGDTKYFEPAGSNASSDSVNATATATNTTTEYDPMWTLQYDSAMTMSSSLASSSHETNSINPLVAVKHQDQHLSLSYHAINGNPLFPFGER
jgi:hypothetical protein